MSRRLQPYVAREHDCGHGLVRVGTALCGGALLRAAVIVGAEHGHDGLGLKAKRGDIGDLRASSSSRGRGWVAPSGIPGPTLGVPSCPGPPGAP